MLHKAFKTWDRSDETLADAERRIHDGVPLEELRIRAERYVHRLVTHFPWASPRPNSIAMEIGGGLGYVMQAAARRFHPRLLIGLDVAPTMAAKATARLRRDGSEENHLTFLIYDGVSLPLAEASVDYVYSVATLQHIPKPYVFNLLLEIKRILAPSGFCALHFLAYKQLRNHGQTEPFVTEIRRQVSGDEGHWHHFYTFDELLYVLADGVGANDIDIVEDDALWVSFGQRGPMFHRAGLPNETHAGSALWRGALRSSSRASTFDPQIQPSGVLRGVIEKARASLRTRPACVDPGSANITGSDTRHVAIHRHLDRLELFDAAVRITGWAFSERGGKALFLETSSGTRYAITSYGLPSPDVAEHHGMSAARARFDEFIRLEEASREIVSGTLVLVTDDDWELTTSLRAP